MPEKRSATLARSLITLITFACMRSPTSVDMLSATPFASALAMRRVRASALEDEDGEGETEPTRASATRFFASRSNCVVDEEEADRDAEEHEERDEERERDDDGERHAFRGRGGTRAPCLPPRPLLLRLRLCFRAVIWRRTTLLLRRWWRGGGVRLRLPRRPPCPKRTRRQTLRFKGPAAWTSRWYRALSRRPRPTARERCHRPCTVRPRRASR
eukprot:NODE_3206_length_2075_cov_2.165811.p2 GENE.NODE_3206_length_2075_cov_2.165811~~NODE_3206_length_2075_cov_2.165811.p2  ORF type:complete len:214 (+),score=33.46 NODE_3206_length_2075_cov_2.165811:1232-1873(+)